MRLDDIIKSIQSVRDEAKNLKRNGSAKDEAIEVRLQVSEDGTMVFYSGDQCYKTDHRGYLGIAVVFPEDTDEVCADTARELIDQVADDAAGADDQSVTALMDGLR